MSFSKIDYIKMIGFVIVVAATTISIVYVPHLDLCISELSAATSKLQDSRNKTLACLNSYQTKVVGKQMFLFEGNMFFLLTKDANARDVLYSKALGLAKSLTREFAALNAGDESEKAMNRVEEEYQRIINDHNLNVPQKIDEAEKLYSDAAKGAFDRIASLQSEYNVKKAQISELENNRRFWYFVFAGLQITGLLLFTGAEMFEKLIKKSPNKGIS